MSDELGTMQLVPVKEGHVSVGPVIMVLAPPKLKLTVKRTAEIKQGATAGETPTYIIGFEGSGMTSDKLVDITTESILIYYSDHGTVIIY